MRTLNQGDIVTGIIGDQAFMFVTDRIRLYASESVLRSLENFEVNAIRAGIQGNHNARTKVFHFLDKRGIEVELGLARPSKGP